MNISEAVEEKVREAYRGVVARDSERIRAALHGLNERESREALGLGLLVCGYVAKDVYPNGPTTTDLQQIAREIISGESEWVNLGSQDSVSNFLGVAVAGDTNFTGIQKDDLVGLIFVCGGHLLATYRREGQHWWEYLDEIWAAVEGTRG